MKVKKKYYVVWQGHTPGIYETWDKCLLQVKAYPNAKYKSFESKEEANNAFLQGYGSSAIPISRSKKNNVGESWKKYVPHGSVAVDAACEGNPGNMEYRGVDPYSGELIFHVGPYRNGTNNIGELLAIVHALALLKKKGQQQVAVYSDSATAISWVRRKKANTKLNFDRSNEAILEMLTRATQWLNENTYSNPVLKWDTEKWGEIPADFGRK